MYTLANILLVIGVFLITVGTVNLSFNVKPENITILQSACHDSKIYNINIKQSSSANVIRIECQDRTIIEIK
jgi:hypothetical protein